MSWTRRLAEKQRNGKEISKAFITDHGEATLPIEKTFTIELHGGSNMGIMHCCSGFTTTGVPIYRDSIWYGLNRSIQMHFG